jgi:hypothetical protein
MATFAGTMGMLLAFASMWLGWYLLMPRNEGRKEGGKDV